MSPSITNKNENTCLVEETEAELIAKCLARNRLSQHKLYNRYARKMLTICSRYSKSLEDAEDTLSEGFARVFDKLDTFKGSGSFEGWMRRIMVNVAIEKFRKKNLKFTDLRNNEYAHASLASGEDIASDLNAKELLNLVQKLPPAYQMVFNLYAFEGLKHKEIAEVLGISEGTSKSNLSDARTWLKKGIENLTTVKIPAGQ